MEIKGSIRASATGIDVGLKGEDGHYHQLATGPLLATISDFYKLVISKNEKMMINDQMFQVTKNISRRGWVKRSVTFPTVLGDITIFRFTPPSGYVPTDRAGFLLEIPTVAVAKMEDVSEGD